MSSPERGLARGVANVPAATRNRSFDILRICFATMVLAAHAAELTDGNRSRELFTRLAHSPMTFGDVGVVGFFLLSGCLIVRSWHRDPEVLNFLQKRTLRIVPGCIVALPLAVVAVGILAPGIHDYFHNLFSNLQHHAKPILPPILPGNPYPMVNGSLWSIVAEFRCYLLVALLGICGLVRRPAQWLAATMVLLGALAAATFKGLHFPHALTLLLGEPRSTLRWTAVFFIGGCFFMLRKSIPFRLGIMLAALFGLVAVDVLFPHYLFFPFAILGGYVMFYLAQLPAVARIQVAHLPDISYGVYLYGWPVESLWIYFRHGSPWITFLASTLICFVLGWLSWHFVERPMLTLKRKSTSALPPDA